ncbi:RseA family anti-sigma factor [Marinobacter pelagius]|uniref:Sigma-E factor negative regulatory protein RseA n=1 Tax=Marinobacter pelagius TaxID=379482 RepID=A0A1I4Y4P5_9GAMM|nr:RseA family anti-sigma factor [Marinobacter pelagius]SFN33054.1 sigma-E factor negative regulatory protein RseA [Marinobacter pelagius]
MDDRLRETLSAMMDDEADELSVRRLLSHHDQARVRDQWQRWQQVRDLMHSGHTPAEGVDVSANVRAALDGRSGAAHHRVLARSASSSSRWRWPAVAMVAVALVVGFGAGAGWDSREGSATAGAPEIAAQAVPDSEVAAAQVREVTLQGLDEEQWEQMSQYLLEHAQHNSVGAGRGAVGYARVVSAGNGY